MKQLDFNSTYALLIFSTALSLNSCKDEGIPPSGGVPSIALNALDASCTEVWLEVKLAAGLQPRTLTLQRDTQTILTTTLIGADTLIVDEGLLPNRPYTYTLTRSNGLFTERVTAAMTTMDTTSHNFTWQIDTLGDGGGSGLYDVAIINDTLAYVVGEIYLSGDPTRYNAAIWNGNVWNAHRVPYYYQGQPFYNPIQTVFAFAHNDIWFGGNGVVHWNGQEYVPVDISSVWGPDRINRIWGRSGNDLYIVGDNGSIAHYTNGTWQRLESGTSETINDVWGGSNTFLGNNVAVMAVGWRATAGESKMLIVRGSSLRADTLSWPYPLQPRRGVWFDRTSKLYTCGGGVYVSSVAGWRYVQEIPSIYTKGIRGNGPNDIAVSGDFGLLTHFNGTSWHVYHEVELQFGSYESIATRGNLTVAVGWSGNRAVAIIGRR